MDHRHGLSYIVRAVDLVRGNTNREQFVTACRRHSLFTLRFGFGIHGQEGFRDWQLVFRRALHVGAGEPRARTRRVPVDETKIREGEKRRSSR